MILGTSRNQPRCDKEPSIEMLGFLCVKRHVKLGFEASICPFVMCSRLDPLGIGSDQGSIFRRKPVFRYCPVTEKFPEFRNFPDFPIGKRFEIQISVFDIFRPDFGVFRPENVVGDRKL